MTKKSIIITAIIAIVLVFLSGCQGESTSSMIAGATADDVTDTSLSPLNVRMTFAYPRPFQSSSGRAVAAQGAHFYIEFARVDDPELYLGATPSADTGGVWTTTSWGAHAVLRVNPTISGLTATGTLRGVPRDQALIARIYQDSDSSSVNDGLSWYFVEGYPLASTWNPGGTSVFGDVGVDVTVEDLTSGTVAFNLVPPAAMSGSADIYLEEVEFYQESFDYANQSAVFAPIGAAVDTTQFTYFNLESSMVDYEDLMLIAGLHVEVDPVFYTDGTSPSTLMLYNADGSLIPSSVEGTASHPTDTGVTIFRQYAAVPVDLTAPSYEEYFTSMTNFVDYLTVTGINRTQAFGGILPFEDVSVMEAEGSDGTQYVAEFDLPLAWWGEGEDVNGILHGDLEYQVLFWTTDGDEGADINWNYVMNSPYHSIASILAESPTVVRDWSTLDTEWNSTADWQLYYPIDFTGPNIDSYAYGFVAVLTRIAGGDGTEFYLGLGIIPGTFSVILN